MKRTWMDAMIDVIYRQRDKMLCSLIFSVDPIMFLKNEGKGCFSYFDTKSIHYDLISLRTDKDTFRRNLNTFFLHYPKKYSEKEWETIK